jgi:hypothetical protein
MDHAGHAAAAADIQVAQPGASQCPATRFLFAFELGEKRAGGHCGCLATMLRLCPAHLLYSNRSAAPPSPANSQEHRAPSVFDLIAARRLRISSRADVSGSSVFWNQTSIQSALPSPPPVCGRQGDPRDRAKSTRSDQTFTSCATAAALLNRIGIARSLLPTEQGQSLSALTDDPLRLWPARDQLAGMEHVAKPGTQDSGDRASRRRWDSGISGSKASKGALWDPAHARLR